MKLRRLLSASLLAISAVFSTAVHSQAYPDKPVRLIVPASPGGGLDVLSRLVAGKLSGYWNQQLVIENRPGAGMASGEADFSITDPVSSIQAAKSGKVRLIAVTAAQRSKAFPQVPTVAESGVPGYVVGTWGGLLAPAGTPAPIVAKVNADARRALAEPDIVAKFEGIGLEIRPGSPDDFARVIQADSERWAKLIKERNLKFGQ